MTDDPVDDEYLDFLAEYDELRSRKETVPLRIVFFVDAWHFRLACRKLTIEKKRQLITRERRQGAFIKPTLLPIEPELASTAAAVTDFFKRRITQRVIELAASELGQDLMAFPERPWPSFLGGPNISSLRARIRECDALVDPLKVLKVFAGKPPSLEYLERQYERALGSGDYEKNSPGYALLLENMALASEGKIKTVFEQNPVSFSDYEHFLSELIRYGRDEERTGHKLQCAITRVDVADAGTISLSEKGVDAYLMLGLLDELGNSETSAMCLISNDSDYYPIIGRIKESSSRPFFLGSTVSPQSISSALRRVVGEEWIVTASSMEDLKEERAYMSPEWAEGIGVPYT